MSKKALITGITGQDGAYLAKLLIDKGYQVYGGMRRISTKNLWRLDYLGITDQVKLVDFDLLEYSNLYETIKTVMPDEVYNLAAQSFVGTSFKQPILTADTDGMAVLRILDILKTLKPDTKFYQASTSEMFGKVSESPQTETTPFRPRSPYGVAKLFGHWITQNYRESYDMFCSSGILFNHESPLRGPEFVTRKIVINAVRIANGGSEPLELGNMESKRDWGYAAEYVEGMYLMLQQDQPDNYVLATGEVHTVREFVEAAFNVLDIELEWSGSGTDEVGINRKTGSTIVRVNPEFYRPAEVDLLHGDANKAKQNLGWEAKTHYQKLVEIMVRSEQDMKA